MLGKIPAALCAPVLLWGQSVLTVDDLVRIALPRNREVAALGQRVAEAEALRRQAGLKPAPNVEFGVATGRPLGTAGKEEYSAGITRTIEMGAKRDRRVDVAGAAVRLAEAELAQRKLALASEIKLRYVDARAERARANEYARLAANFTESLRLMKARVEHGDAAELDARMLQVELERARVQQRLAEGRERVALLDLRRLCGIAANEPLSLAGMTQRRAGLPDASALTQRALERRPDLAAARIAEQRGESELALAKAQASPDVNLGARYAMRNERYDGLYGLTANGQAAPLRDRDHMLSVEVSVPLFARRNAAPQSEAAAARGAAARSMRQHMEASIPLEVRAAHQHWEDTLQAAKTLRESVLPQAARNLDVVTQAYKLGQLRFSEVLNEQRRIIEIEMARIDAEADAQRSWFELERAVGGELQ